MQTLYTSLQERMIETLGGDILPNTYNERTNLIKSYLTKKPDKFSHFVTDLKRN